MFSFFILATRVRIPLGVPRATPVRVKTYGGFSFLVLAHLFFMAHQWPTGYGGLHAPSGAVDQSLTLDFGSKRAPPCSPAMVAVIRTSPSLVRLEEKRL